MISSLFADLAGAIYAHLFVQSIPRGRADRFARTRPVGKWRPVLAARHYAPAGSAHVAPSGSILSRRISQWPIVQEYGGVDLGTPCTRHR